jgi:two-component system OmpR family response regulator
MVNILIVEDNAGLRQLMKIHIERAGYAVYEAADGEQALEVLEKVSIHLMIVDIMMPKMDGYELTAELRGADMKIPVLIATAKESLEDKRRGFHSGADDYMVKPINMEELLLRVEALLRRANMSKNRILTVGEVSLNQESLAVIKGQHITVLAPKEFLLLQMLLSYPSKIFTRQALMDEIWGYDSETDPRTVDVHIKRLRERFNGYDDFRIETVRGLGYKAEVKK